jgi:hypothetical protein
MFSLVSTRQSLRGRLLTGVELETDEEGVLNEVAAAAIHDFPPAHLLVLDVGRLARDSLLKSIKESPGAFFL